MKFESESVLAVVVTYEPDDSLQMNLEALRVQVGGVLIIDNASKNSEYVRGAATATKCVLIQNTTNVGVARAFNQGFEFAASHGFQWLATFDQDSQVTPGMIPGLLDSYHNRHSFNVGVLAPLHLDRNTGRHYHVPQHVLVDAGEWRLLRTTISSGSLIPIAVLQHVGGFDERLFIDFVDHDFCVRCRQSGYFVLESKRHILIHSLGSLSEHSFLGRRILCSNHSSVRRYYMTRNQLEVYRRYMAFDTWWSIRGLFDLLVGSLTVLIYEGHRLAKARAMLRGGMHFVCRRFGPLGR